MLQRLLHKNHISEKHVCFPTSKLLILLISSIYKLVSICILLRKVLHTKFHKYICNYLQVVHLAQLTCKFHKHKSSTQYGRCDRHLHVGSHHPASKHLHHQAIVEECFVRRGSRPRSFNPFVGESHQDRSPATGRYSRPQHPCSHGGAGLGRILTRSLYFCDIIPGFCSLFAVVPSTMGCRPVRVPGQFEPQPPTRSQRIRAQRGHPCRSGY